MSKKSPRADKKLFLKRETLKRLTRGLEERELVQVAGGAPCTTGSVIPTAACDG